MVDRRIGQVFGDNLRQLCVKDGSPSATARKLGISHVQMHRYLRGESFPKPGQLKLLCDYFGTDARIMTDPLPFSAPGTAQAREQINFTDINLPILRALAYAVHTQDYMPARSAMPDGAYLAWKNSLARPGQVTASVYVVKTINGARVSKTFDPFVMFPNIKAGRADVAWRSPRLRETRGILLDQPEGVALVTFNLPPAQWVGLCFLSPYHRLNEGILTGVQLFGRKEYPDVRRIGRMVWAPLPAKLSAILAASRMPVWQNIDEVPEYVAEILRQPIG